MAPYRVHFAHDVEQERIDVVVQCLTSCDSKHSETRECEGRGCGAETGAPYLVVQEQLGQKAQVLHQPATIFSKQHQLASCDHSPGSTFYSCCRPPQTLRCCPCGRSRPRGGAAPCFAPAGAQRRSGRERTAGGHSDGVSADHMPQQALLSAEKLQRELAEVERAVSEVLLFAQSASSWPPSAAARRRLGGGGRTCGNGL